MKRRLFFMCVVLQIIFYFCWDFKNPFFALFRQNTPLFSPKCKVYNVMGIFLPVLFISLLSVTIFLFFAFFPIRVIWFYQSNNYRPPKKSSAQKSDTKYDFSQDYRAYGKHENFDDYDDPEL